ncbi:MAG TPA: PIG-L deacetylase family protein [Polyangiales bacterium]|nr:PIG-L deacetylase family protein [Polyangiales bacterium]
MISAQGGVLSVWAHPDDEAICAAGTMVLCAARGEPVHVVCATRGEQGPISDAALATRDTLASVRERELYDSCALCGAYEPEFLDLPDGGVPLSQHADALHKLVISIRRLRPRVLLGFGPDGLYGHPDHTVIGELTDRARRDAADPHVSTPGLEPYRVPRHFHAVWTREQVRELLAVLEAQGTKAQLWNLTPDQFPRAEQDVTARVDVRSVIAQKLQAIRAHRTQLKADHALRVIDEASALHAIGIERFRCTDNLPGDPLTRE